MEGGEVGWVGIDVPDEEGRAIPTKLVVADNSWDDGVSSCCFGGVAVRAAVAIDIIPMNKTTCSAFVMGNKLSPSQFNEFGQSLETNIKRKACIRG